MKTETRFPSDGPSCDIVTGCEVSGSVTQAPAAAEIVRRAMAPAPKRQIEEWLAELSVLVIKRHDDEFSEAMRLEAYAARLARYPADVARAAVLGKSWRFWPAWQELEVECERLVSPRRHMLAALEAPKERKSAGLERVRVTPERAAEILREYGFGGGAGQ